MVSFSGKATAKQCEIMKIKRMSNYLQQQQQRVSGSSISFCTDFEERAAVFTFHSMLGDHDYI